MQNSSPALKSPLIDYPDSSNLISPGLVGHPSKVDSPGEITRCLRPSPTRARERAQLICSPRFATRSGPVFSPSPPPSRFRVGFQVVPGNLPEGLAAQTRARCPEGAGRKGAVLPEGRSCADPTLWSGVPKTPGSEQAPFSFKFLMHI